MGHPEASALAVRPILRGGDFSNARLFRDQQRKALVKQVTQSIEPFFVTLKHSSHYVFIWMDHYAWDAGALRTCQSHGAQRLRSLFETRR